MGRYIAFIFDIAKASSWPAGFEPAFRSEFFRPVELTAKSFNHRRPPIRFGDANAHLDDELLVTFTKAPSLSRHDLEDCEKWVSTCRGATIDLEGAVDLSDPANPDLPLRDCFEFVGVASTGARVKGGPFVHLHCTTPDQRQEKSQITIYAWSTVWVTYGDSVERCWHSLGGHISPRLADEYLVRLASFCRLLVEPNVKRIQYAALGIGDNFYHDRARISAAFELGLSGLGLTWDVH